MVDGIWFQRFFLVFLFSAAPNRVFLFVLGAISGALGSLLGSISVPGNSGN